MSKLLYKIGKNSRVAFRSKINSKIKNKVLEDYCRLIIKNKNKIISQNKKDIKSAKLKKLKENLIKRLSLNSEKINYIIKSIKTVIKFKNPVDIELNKWKRPNGLKIKRVTIPIGIIGIIYESRPNVTADVSTLCFKSGNCVILRGGSEAYFSNKILANLFRQSLKKNNINMNYVQFVNNKDRKLVDFMLSKMSKYIDVIIPRGGKNLVKKVQDLSSVPVIGHLEGICHTYIDKDANIKMAKQIIINAKLRNTSICGATETLLIHKNNSKFVNNILKELKEHGCDIYADSKIKKLYLGETKTANQKIWSKEFLSAKISVKLVKDIYEAIHHINKYGTMHTDSIITKNKKSAKIFIKNVKTAVFILDAGAARSVKYLPNSCIFTAGAISYGSKTPSITPFDNMGGIRPKGVAIPSAPRA